MRLSAALSQSAGTPSPFWLVKEARTCAFGTKAHEHTVLLDQNVFTWKACIHDESIAYAWIVMEM
jgi:hypothetical protein